MFHSDHYMYMVTPVGFDEYTTVVIATDKADAYRKAMLMDNVSHAVNSHGVELKCVNLNEAFAGRGWEIFLARKGAYH